MEDTHYKIRRRSDGKFFSCLFYEGGWDTNFDETGDFLTMDDLELYFDMADNLEQLNIFDGCHIVQFKLVETKEEVNEGQLRFERMMFERI